MSNYLRGLGRAVGITDDAAQGGQADDMANNYDWENLSQTSGRRDINVLRGGLGQEAELPQRGGGVSFALPSANNSIASPTQRERYQEPRGDGIGHIPRSVTQQDAVDVQSNISVAGGYDQRGGERGLENTPGQRPQAAEDQLQMGGDSRGPLPRSPRGKRMLRSTGSLTGKPALVGMQLKSPRSRSKFSTNRVFGLSPL